MAGVPALFALDTEGAKARMALRKAMKTSPKNAPYASSASSGLVLQDRGRIGPPNAQAFRNWAEHGEWVRSALNIRRDQFAQAEWIIEPEDHTMKWDKGAARACSELLKRPNPVDEFWDVFIKQIVEDLLVLDAGSIEKERTVRGGLGYLHVVDGAEVRVDKFWDGNPDEPRYYWYPDFQERASFKNDELVYMRANPMSYRVVGLAPLETLKMAVDAELNGQTYNIRQMISPAPDGILDLGEQARQETVDKFKAYWRAEVAGKGAMAFLGGTKGAKWTPFRMGNREMQFLEFQLYLARKIAAVFGMSLQDLGVPLDTNRSTASQTNENTEDRGIRPLLSLGARYITHDIVKDEEFGGPSNNMAFKFTTLNLKESTTRAQRNRYALAGIPWTTVDEVRKLEGVPPIGGTLGTSLIAMGSQGPLLLTEGQIPTPLEAAQSKQALPAGPQKELTDFAVSLSEE